MNYCRRCGAALEPEHDGAYRCLNGHTLYLNPAPASSLFLLHENGSIIFSVRGIEPRKGMLDSFGGFVDSGETFESALARELKEETGLTPEDYSMPIYLTSATGPYEYGGEARVVLSNFYYATLRSGAEVQALDDVGSIKILQPSEVNLDDFGESDVKDGFKALLGVLPVVY